MSFFVPPTLIQEINAGFESAEMKEDARTLLAAKRADWPADLPASMLAANTDRLIGDAKAWLRSHPCPWCGAVAQNEPHLTWCVHSRRDPRGS